MWIFSTDHYIIKCVILCCLLSLHCILSGKWQFYTVLFDTFCLLSDCLINILLEDGAAWQAWHLSQRMNHPSLTNLTFFGWNLSCLSQCQLRLWFVHLLADLDTLEVGCVSIMRTVFVWQPKWAISSAVSLAGKDQRPLFFQRADSLSKFKSICQCIQWNIRKKDLLVQMIDPVDQHFKWYQGHKVRWSL